MVNGQLIFKIWLNIKYTLVQQKWRERNQEIVSLSILRLLALPMVQKNLAVSLSNSNIWNCTFVLYLPYNEISFFVNKVGGRYINYTYYITSFARGMFDIKMVLAALQMEWWYCTQEFFGHFHLHTVSPHLQFAQTKLC